MQYRNLPAATALLAICSTAGAQVHWEASVDAALERARAEKKVIFIALNMDGERANDRMVAEHYQDPILVKLSRHTINLFCSNDVHGKRACTRCPGTTCAQHRGNDVSVRRDILKVSDTTPIVAPQHIFVAPDGAIISSAAHFITEGELEWMWVDAIREVQPTFAFSPSGRTRAPERFEKGDADKTPVTGKPPTEEEVEKALKDIKKLGGNGGGGNWRRLLNGAFSNARVIIRSDDRRALDWAKGALRSYDRFRNGMIRDIGNLSPASWAKVIEKWSAYRNDETRRLTVIALEKLANPNSVRLLRKHVKKEKDPTIRGRFYRAMAICGPTNRSVIAAVGRAIKSEDNPAVRAHAVVAAGKLEDRAAVTEYLQTALQDEDVLVRSVAGYVIAIRQDRELVESLRFSRRAETVADVAEWFDKAAQAVRSGDTTPFKRFLTDVLDGPGANLEMDAFIKKWLDDREKKKPGKGKSQK